MKDRRKSHRGWGLGAIALAASVSMGSQQQDHDSQTAPDSAIALIDEAFDGRVRVETTLGIGVLTDLAEHPEHTPERATLPTTMTAAVEPVAQRVLREELGWIELEDEEDSVLGSRIWMNVGRTSALRDGGIAAERGVTTDPLRGFAGAQGDFDLYDLSVRWEALKPGPVELNLLGGVRAIQSAGGMWRTESGPTSPRGDELGVFETYDEHRSLTTLPVIGGGVRVALSEWLTLSTSATTHSSGDAESYYDLVMETSIGLGEGIGLHAGYQEVRSALDETGVAEPWELSGVFARLTIEF